MILRCGECKLDDRKYLFDDEGNLLKDEYGTIIYDVFTAESYEQMQAHLEISHGLEQDSVHRFACFDCRYWYKLENMPIGWDSAGGLMEWCYDCAQRRCLGYSDMRRYILSILDRAGIEADGKMSSDELLEKLTELLGS